MSGLIKEPTNRAKPMTDQLGPTDEEIAETLLRHLEEFNRWLGIAEKRGFEVEIEPHWNTRMANYKTGLTALLRVEKVLICPSDESKNRSAT